MSSEPLSSADYLRRAFDDMSRDLFGQVTLSKARAFEIINEIERLRARNLILTKIEALCADEGDSVEIVYPNPSFDGPDYMIVVTRNFVDETEFAGNSREECLDAALAARASGSEDQSASAET